MSQADFLVEIGTEELPPKALRSLSDAFREGLRAGLESASLDHGAIRGYATPRRLAVLVEALHKQQPDRLIERRGPPARVAFDADGEPSRAARAFAESNGVDVAALERLSTDKGEWLVYRGIERGRPAAELLPGLVRDALAALPIPRRMRWGAGEAEFVRPVHWVVLLLGQDVLDREALFGLVPDRTSRGHRFHAPEPLQLERPADYAARLESARVVADFAARRERIRAGVIAAARDAGGRPLLDEALLDEVTALTEWPVAQAGRFEERFLELPAEVLIATLQDHQRYFPLVDPRDDRLMPWFVAVSNIDSLQPDVIRAGNERVVRPRLADAAFFYDLDRQRPLAARREELAQVVFQSELGTLADKSRRIAALARQIAGQLGVDVAAAERAAELAKCDLLTALVGEFPELQGIMGRYYALHDGETEGVAWAIEEQYRPRYAGDALPASGLGQVLALADKLDTLAGIFAIGQRPTGTRDPFGLRRAAIGVLRTIIEQSLELDLLDLLPHVANAQPVGGDRAALASDLYEFLIERLRAYYVEGGSGRSVAPELFEAVRSRRPAQPLDFDARLRAVEAFVRLDAAASLAAANKRISNILRKAGEAPAAELDEGALTEPAERRLYSEMRELRERVEPLVARREYARALSELAGLREAVDRFFDEVLVMSDDAAQRANRLALLDGLRRLFMSIADISLLSPG